MHDAQLRDGLDDANVAVLEKLLKRIYKNVPSFRAAEVTAPAKKASVKTVAAKKAKAKTPRTA